MIVKGVDNGKAERSAIGVLWNDPEPAIAWDVTEPLLSAKDRAYALLRNIVPEFLQCYEPGRKD